MPYGEVGGGEDEESRATERIGEAGEMLVAPSGGVKIAGMGSGGEVFSTVGGGVSSTGGGGGGDV